MPIKRSGLGGGKAVKENQAFYTAVRKFFEEGETSAPTVPLPNEPGYEPPLKWREIGFWAFMHLIVPVAIFLAMIIAIAFLHWFPVAGVLTAIVIYFAIRRPE
jgi:hypothetical protein